MIRSSFLAMLVVVAEHDYDALHVVCQGPGLCLPKSDAVITVRDMSTYSLGAKLRVVSTSSIDMQVLY